MTSSRRQWAKCLGLGLSSSALLWLSFFPANIGVLSLVALVPLILLSNTSANGKQRYASAWLSGLTFFLSATSWMRVADDTMINAWLCLSAYCSLYFPTAVWLLRRIDRRTG